MSDELKCCPFQCDNCGHRPSPQEVVKHQGDCAKCGDTVIAYTVDAAEHIAALLEGLKVAKEALEGYAECSDGCTCGDGWSHNSAEAALKSISALLSTEAQQ